MRGWVVVGALVIAGLAVYVLTVGKPSASTRKATPPAASRAPVVERAPAMDQIDEESREAMRELLRHADED